MERANLADNDGKIFWKKVGGGSLRFNGKIIKPGQTFRASVDEIPKSFRDLVIPLEKIVEKGEEPIVVVNTVYSMQPRGKSKSLFDIVDGNGKVLNEKALNKETAQKLIEDLSK